MLLNIFETNNLANIQVEVFDNSKIYVMDNFYKRPEELLNHLLYVREPLLWKGEETPSYNGSHFLDLRHSFDSYEFKKVGLQLSTICGQLAPAAGTVKTNFIKLIDKDFNNYSNNYWAPHRDMGYTALIYLNNIDTATNLYEQIDEDVWNTPEHYEPWRSKNKYRILKKLEGKFNRLVMFNGKKFLHGMDISSDDFLHALE